jgi:hypothetical protein
MDDDRSEDRSASRFDGRFDAAAADFRRAQSLFIGELLLISKLVREDYPAGTLIVTDGQFHDDSELKVRVQQVRAGAEVLFDIEADGEFGNLDDIDGKLCWLGLLNPDVLSPVRACCSRPARWCVKVARSVRDSAALRDCGWSLVRLDRGCWPCRRVCGRGRVSAGPCRRWRPAASSTVWSRCGR